MFEIYCNKYLYRYIIFYKNQFPIYFVLYEASQLLLYSSNENCLPVFHIIYIHTYIGI